jgi:hypothetical protein
MEGRQPNILSTGPVASLFINPPLALCQMKAQYPRCKILLFSGQAATRDLLDDACSQGHDF